jgi:hypothetical protein
MSGYHCHEEGAILPPMGALGQYLSKCPKSFTHLRPTVTSTKADPGVQGLAGVCPRP